MKNHHLTQIIHGKEEALLYTTKYISRSVHPPVQIIYSMWWVMKSNTRVTLYYSIFICDVLFKHQFSLEACRGAGVGGGGHGGRVVTLLPPTSEIGVQFRVV